tara:strand:- start:967 stop:1767 length:801 start_codon:yes stop_codon:yes gene_type:complete
MENPLVSVLTLNYRNPNAAVVCVQKFLEQTIVDKIEILVIDNHSDDESVGVLRNRIGDHPQVRIIETPGNHGFGYGYNTGVRYASGEFILINNPDKTMPPEGLEKLVSRMQSDETIGILAPKLVHADGTNRLSIRRFPHLIDIISRRSFLGKICPGCLRRYLMLDKDTEQMQEVDWVVGGCFLIRRDLFEQLGGFDERFFLFFEDTDLCRRVGKSGKKIVYDPSVAVGDKKNRLSGQSFVDLFLKKTGRIHISSALKYFWKWKGTA